MIAIRSLIFFIMMNVTVILFATAMIVVRPFTSHQTASRIGTAWGSVTIKLLKLICRLDHEIVGWENLPADGGYLILSNHQSTWETMSLRGLLPFDQAWVLKKELMSLPFFGWALKASNQIAIDRSAGKKALKDLIGKGSEAMEQGRIVIIFPEGTRVPFGEQGKFNIGGAMLAEKSGCKVVPIVHNAGLFWPRHSILKYPGTIRMVIGEPFTSEGMKAGEINRKVSEWIAEESAKMQQSR